MLYFVLLRGFGLTVKSSESILRNWIRLVIHTRNRVLGLKLVETVNKRKCQILWPRFIDEFCKGMNNVLQNERSKFTRLMFTSEPFNKGPTKMAAKEKSDKSGSERRPKGKSRQLKRLARIVLGQGTRVRNPHWGYISLSLGGFSIPIAAVKKRMGMWKI